MAKKIKKDPVLKAPKVPLWPLMTGLVVMLAVLALFNSQLIVASVRAYIIPDTAQITESTLTETYSGAPRIVVPRINVDAPVIYDMNHVTDKEVQGALQNGVLHFGGSAAPGDKGNSVYVGHSSGQPWAPGDYNFIFMRLADLQNGDRIYVYKESGRHIYEVYEKKVVKPNDVSVLENNDTAIATLITCWPLGTNIDRLVVQARLVSDPVEVADKDVSDAPGLSDTLSEQELPGTSYDPVQALRARLEQ